MEEQAFRSPQRQRQKPRQGIEGAEEARKVQSKASSSHQRQNRGRGSRDVLLGFVKEPHRIAY